jgi:hypothetical protein
VRVLLPVMAGNARKWYIKAIIDHIKCAVPVPVRFQFSRVILLELCWFCDPGFLGREQFFSFTEPWFLAARLYCSKEFQYCVIKNNNQRVPLPRYQAMGVGRAVFDAAAALLIEQLVAQV